MFPGDIKRDQWEGTAKQTIYMIASTKVLNTEIFTSITVLVFRLLIHKVLFINRKDKKNC